MFISIFKGSPSHIAPIFTKVKGPDLGTSTNNLWAGVISVLIMTPFFYAGFDTIPWPEFIQNSVPALACLKIRRTEPSLKRPYKVPCGRLGIGAACLAGSIIIGLMIIPINPAALKTEE